ncbi:DUF4330 domain-containing protein [Anaerotalea alkaliphila]|uniref:DUF4330 domain-containing protein n=1 Tax=Anaerotalea alkaliphila TaxID=2662126 RepID=A0A7X5HTR1_9FIRM|nr:DUF4330 domain-containing protein [Anaerotalea alkaliphila]NDL66510.1 DUF4330 domain-containing protein [Anaerotalea alkaliphila]
MNTRNKRFNWVDGLVLLLVLAVGAGGFYFLQQRKASGGGVETGKREIVFLAEAVRVLPEVAASVEIGDRIVALNAIQDGEVVGVEIFDTQREAAVDGAIVAVSDPNSKTLRVTIRATVNRYGPYMDFGGQEIKVGSSYWIKTEGMHALGSVVAILEKEAGK